MYLGRAFISGFLVASAAVAHPYSRRFIFTERGYISSADTAGAFIVEDNGTFQDMDTTFVVPNISAKPQSSVSAFISLDLDPGLDGVSCDAYLQAGVLLAIRNDGTPLYKAFSVFHPGPTNFYDLQISAGDIVELHISAASTTSASVFIRNFNTSSETGLETLTSTVPLCQGVAGWGVQAFTDPVINFGSVAFQDCVAQGSGGRFFPSDSAAKAVEIAQDRAIMASTTVEGSDVTIAYSPHA